MWGKRILVLCAHHDDETLGAGGLIAKLSADSDVAIAILGEGPVSRDPSQGRIPIRNDCEKAAAVLGVTNHLYMNAFLPDQRFDTLPLLEVAQKVEGLLEKYHPETVITHWHGDVNQDHQAVARAVQVATRPQPGQCVRRVLAMETPSSSEWGTEVFHPTVFVPLDEEHVMRKVAAMELYESEKRPAPHPRSPQSLTALARYRGSQCGHPWAEAFVLLREVR